MERGELAVLATYIAMASSLDALDLPIQLFAVGTAFFGIGLLISMASAVS
jgi:hypothetical protein